LLLAASQEMFDVLKLVGLKRLLPEVVPEGVAPEVVLPQAATAIPANATTLTRLTRRPEPPVPRPNTFLKVIETSL
jgi:hypothetical protein